MNGRKRINRKGFPKYLVYNGLDFEVRIKRDLGLKFALPSDCKRCPVKSFLLP
jgi:hypothetical protein